MKKYFAGLGIAAMVLAGCRQPMPVEMRQEKDGTNVYVDAPNAQRMCVMEYRDLEDDKIIDYARYVCDKGKVTGEWVPIKDETKAAQDRALKVILEYGEQK